MAFILQSVCDRLDIEYGDRLSSDSYKRKFLVTRLPEVLVSSLLLRAAYGYEKENVSSFVL